MQSTITAVIKEGNERTLPTKIHKVIWDNASEFATEFQSWWQLVNFTYHLENYKIVAFLLTIHNVRVYTIYPIITLGLNDNETVLYPLEHRVWAHQKEKGDKQ